MVQVKGYWIVQVISLIILVSIFVVLWDCGESGCDQEASLLSSYSTAYVCIESGIAESCEAGRE